MHVHTANPTLAALVAALVALIAATAPATAQSGTYTVHACKTPGGGAAGDQDWPVGSAAGNINRATHGCPVQALKLSMRSGVAHPANDSITATFSAPADTDIAGYTLWRTAKLAGPYNYYTFETTRTGGTVIRESCEGACSGLGGDQPLDNDNSVSASGLTNVSRVAVRLTCGIADNSNDTCPGDEPAAQMWLHRADVVLNDIFRPEILTVAGPLVDSAGPLTGVQAVTIDASDRGGGVDEAMLEVDGAVVSRSPIGACARPFTAAVPCKRSASATLGLDTAVLADGPHRLRLLVTDATGTNVEAWGPITIATANRACNPEPRIKTLKLRAGVARGSGKRRMLRSVVTTSGGRRVRIAGRLLTPDGTPVAGARVCVAVRHEAANAPLRNGPQLTTDAEGRFSYRTGRGPSRRLYFVHRTAEGAIADSVLVRARAPVTLSASRRRLRTGQSIIFRGRLRGGPIPAEGVLLAIQAHRTAGEWQTFGNARTSRSGRFHFRYRFTRTSGVQRYTFRARVPQQGGYPYTTGKSNRLRVRVTGP